MSRQTVLEIGSRTGSDHAGGVNRTWLENLIGRFGATDEFSFFNSTGGGDFLRRSRRHTGRSRE